VSRRVFVSRVQCRTGRASVNMRRSFSDVYFRKRDGVTQ